MSSYEVSMKLGLGRKGTDETQEEGAESQEVWREGDELRRKRFQSKGEGISHWHST